MSSGKLKELQNDILMELPMVYSLLAREAPVNGVIMGISADSGGCEDGKCKYFGAEQ